MRISDWRSDVCSSDLLTQGYWGRQFAGVHDLDLILPAADFVSTHSGPNELVALSGQDWNPAVFYYARREGFMVRGSVEPEDLAAPPIGRASCRERACT